MGHEQDIVRTWYKVCADNGVNKSRRSRGALEWDGGQRKGFVKEIQI